MDLTGRDITATEINGKTTAFEFVPHEGGFRLKNLSSNHFIPDEKNEGKPMKFTDRETANNHLKNSMTTSRLPGNLNNHSGNSDTDEMTIEEEISLRVNRAKEKAGK